VRALIVLGLAALLLAGCAAGGSSTAGPTYEPSEALTSSPPPPPGTEPTPEATPMPTDTPRQAQFSLISPAFGAGEGMPSRYSCDGRDVSPPLDWTDVPVGTKTLLLTVIDADARDFVHWVAWDLAPDAGSLAEGASGVMPGGAVEGGNDFGGTGWGGPCPPSGTHRYVFTLVALSAPLGLPPGTKLAAVQRQAAGVMLGQARLEGTYRR
jgi:hypothetical protein